MTANGVSAVAFSFEENDSTASRSVEELRLAWRAAPEGPLRLSRRAVSGALVRHHRCPALRRVCSQPPSAAAPCVRLAASRRYWLRLAFVSSAALLLAAVASIERSSPHVLSAWDLASTSPSRQPCRRRCCAHRASLSRGVRRGCARRVAARALGSQPLAHRFSGLAVVRGGRRSFRRNRSDSPGRLHTQAMAAVARLAALRVVLRDPQSPSGGARCLCGRSPCAQWTNRW